MKFEKTFCSALAAIALSGCATPLPSPRKADRPPFTESTVATEMSDSWNNTAVERSGRASVVLVTPFSIPAAIRANQLMLELEAGATVKDLVAVLANLGYSIILADESVGEKKFYLPKFKGTVGSLVNTVSRATDVWFTWVDGSILVSGTEKISVTLPQEESLGAKITEGLIALGVERPAMSWEAGMVTFEVTPSQLAKVRVFLKRITNNAALVSLQVAIVNVQMTHDTKQGIDWTKLQLAVGSKFAPSGIQTMEGLKPIAGNSSFAGASTGANGTPTGATPGGTTGTGTTGTGATTATPTTGANEALTAVGLAGGGFKGLLTNSMFSFTGLYDFLQTYGSTETKQNVVLKTIAGTSVELKSLTQTPYVESIAVTNSGSNGTAAGASSMGSAKTAKADDGITLKMTPTFDAAANTVTVKMELALKAVLGFNALSAGNQIGTLSQPTTAERSFNDVLRVRPGQTVVVGGITFDSVSEEGNAPNAMSSESKYSHKGLKISRNSLFIVVRPTVSSLGQLGEEESVDIFSPAAYVPPLEAIKGHSSSRTVKKGAALSRPLKALAPRIIPSLQNKIPLSLSQEAEVAEGYSALLTGEPE